ncbi:MAG: helix-turn-helix transcriptional regulator [Clostridia bacterium]|jgi:DNA-binding XRE family transcriptional regulator|nr:helix-turn-helix transcriptional regulator [Clostridia bacterium]
MKCNSVRAKDINKELLKDKEVIKEYDKLKVRYDIVSEIVRIRAKENITQAELAYKVGTQKSNISRLESGNYNPSIDFLNKVARGLGKELVVEFK